jgi:hypothetical protein
MIPITSCWAMAMTAAMLAGGMDTWHDLHEPFDSGLRERRAVYGTAAARRYAPDLLPRMAAATVRFALAQPNFWECLEPHSGQPALYDEGHCVMPGTSSVVDLHRARNRSWRCRPLLPGSQ